MSDSHVVPLRVKPGRQFPFLARHPWVHAHALADDGQSLQCGQVVDLLDHDGNWLGRGLVNPASRLRVRLYSFIGTEALDATLWKKRIDQAIARRRLQGPANPRGAERLVFSESDLISGLIVDRYADCLSVQFTAAALMKWRRPILEHLKEVMEARVIRVRVESKTAKYEGIEAEESWYEDAALTAPIGYEQNDLQLEVDLNAGQKTGAYLDQRVNHREAASYLAGRRVLDVCCYTGGFGLVAAKQGAASVLGIDSSNSALAAAQQAAQRNGLEQISFRAADCFDELKSLASQDQSFDAVVLDPPRFAGSRHQLDRALRAYGRLNTLAIDLLPPGGILVTCSCSGRVSRADFLNMLLDVSRRGRRDLIVMQTRGAAPDHPMAISCPESDYLKCVIAEVR